MDGTPKQKIDVNLTLVGQNGSSGWNMEVVGQGKGGPNHYPPAKAAHGSAAEFHFVIGGPGTQNITFAAVNPLSIAPDTGKGSPTEIGINSDQIINVSNGGGKVLTFTDKNQDPAVKLTYQLNFANATSLDPIIENGGGGPPGFQTFYYYAGAALLVALVAALLLRSRWAKRSVMRDENDRL